MKNLIEFVKKNVKIKTGINLDLRNRNCKLKIMKKILVF